MENTPNKINMTWIEGGEKKEAESVCPSARLSQCVMHCVFDVAWHFSCIVKGMFPGFFFSSLFVAVVFNSK